jgi:hypothetical protein
MERRQGLQGVGGVDRHYLRTTPRNAKRTVILTVRS